MQTVDAELAECLELRKLKQSIEPRLAVLTEMLAVFYVIKQHESTRKAARRLNISHVEVIRLIKPYR